MRSASIYPAAALVSSLIALLPLAAHANVSIGSLNLNPLTNGLVGYWPFDGNTTNWSTGRTFDLSSQANNLALSFMSTSTSPSAGKIGQAFKFNGTSNCITGPDISPLVTLDSTASYWFKETKKQASNNPLTTGQNHAGDTFAFLNFSNQGNPIANVASFTNGSTTASMSSFNPGITWHQFIATRSSTTGVINLYLDGVLGATATGGTGPINLGSSLNKTLQIGARCTGSANYFSGTIDDVRIYSRALSAQEVALLYASGQAQIGTSPVGASTPTGIASSTAPLSSGLVAYWPLDGNTTNWASASSTLDVSGNGSSGRPTGLATSTSPVPGKIGQAIRFTYSPSSNIFFAAPSALSDIDLQGGFTASFWINPVTYGQFNNGIILDKAGANLVTTANGGWLIAYSGFGANGKIYFVKSYDSTILNVETNVGMSRNKWTHVTVTWDGSASASNVHIYFNGIEVSSYRVRQNGVGNKVSDATKGFRMGWLDTQLDGRLDDVRIYNRALSAQEVQQLYARGSATIGQSNNVTLNSGLVGYWPLDGNTTHWQTNKTDDLSGNGNTGTLVSMSTSSSPTIGKIGQTFKFDGIDDLVTIADGSNTFAFANTTFTVSVWVKTTSITAALLAAKDDGALGNGWGLGVGAGGFCSGNAKGSGGAIAAARTGTTFIADGRWHLCTLFIRTDTVTQGNNDITVYTDGAVAQGSNTNSTTYVSPTLPLTLGMRTGGTPNFFAGSIDDMRIYMGSGPLAKTTFSSIWGTISPVHNGGSSRPTCFTASSIFGINFLSDTRRLRHAVPRQSL